MKILFDWNFVSWPPTVQQFTVSHKQVVILYVKAILNDYECFGHYSYLWNNGLWIKDIEERVPYVLSDNVVVQITQNVHMVFVG